jgi:hypothetical protein
MKIGIHYSGDDFSARWINYCREKEIPYKVVDCSKSDIIDQLSDCGALMWHFHQTDPREILFAKQLIYSLQAAGKRVFPDFNTVWHFDDKVGQKYLLESVGAPIAPAWVFYDRKEALNWVSGAKFPKVFKLRGGAGSENVKLVRSAGEARTLINKAFGKGFLYYDSKGWFIDSLKKYAAGRANLTDLRIRFVKLFRTPEHTKVAGRQKGYIYFQEFIPGNDHDIRIIIIKDKAFAIKRMVRKNDFRASGSGDVRYERELFDEKLVELSFSLSDTLKVQSVALDFVHQDGKPLLVEISYGFFPKAYDICPGYWDKDLTWHEGKFNPYGWMVENLIS